MSLEDQLSGWTGPSSDTEKDKQDRTERIKKELKRGRTIKKGAN